MSTALCFNGITLSPVIRQDSLWIRATELARALGYKRADILNKLYTTHADEFTQDMTQVVEIVDNTESVFPVKLRIFSLRGCHLIAMFARTPVAKAFRRWVLDVLDELAKEERALHCADVNPFSLTPAEQAQLHAIVAAKVGMLPKETQRKAYALPESQKLSLTVTANQKKTAYMLNNDHDVTRFFGRFGDIIK